MSEEKKYGVFRVIARIIPLQLKAAPWNTILQNVIAIIHGLCLTWVVVATQQLFDMVARGAQGKATYTQCLISLLVLGAATLGKQLLNGLHNYHGNGILVPKSTGRLEALIHEKILKVDPVNYEKTEFLNQLNKALGGIEGIVQFAMLVFMIVNVYGIYFISIGAYLFYLKPILIVTLLLAFVPAILGQSFRVKVFLKLDDVSAPLRRECDYYQKALCDREYFKETRILGGFQYFFHLFDDTLKRLNHEIWVSERKACILILLLNVTTYAGMAVSSFLLFQAVMDGEITVGMFAAVYASLGQIFSIMKEVVERHMGNMTRDMGKVINLIRLLDLPERTGEEGTADYSKGIEANAVSFTYPGRTEPAVDQVTMRIAAGETVAIVGENGAGKTTLVRLLTGIYQPSKGTVLAGGLDTQKTAPASLYQGISGVFQKFQKYKMTLRDNVAVSRNLEGTQDDQIQSALKESGMEMENLTLDDMLSPEFDGVDLSGGQWQRVAIARGLYRTNDFIVLDEPTSAIDPVEETKIFKQFQKLAKGKCGVIVTHRLGSVKLADRIIVMEAGKIVDTGTHEELISRPGKYAELWEAQAQWYERPADRTSESLS